MKKIFTINCGSTSTKVAYFEDDVMVNKVSLDVTSDQLKQMPKTLQQLDSNSGGLSSRSCEPRTRQNGG